MGGKGGGGNSTMMYAAQPDPVGHADPIDLTSNQAYINAQKAARDATAPAPPPPDAPPNVASGDDTAGTALANAVLAPPNYWFNQPVSTLQPASLKKSSMVTTNAGSV